MKIRKILEHGFMRKGRETWISSLLCLAVVTLLLPREDAVKRPLPDSTQMQDRVLIFLNLQGCYLNEFIFFIRYSVW